MYQVMQGESSAIIVYLEHIWGTPLFNLELETYKIEGRNDILTQWGEVRGENAKKVQSLESALQQYPYSPELYYNLFLLYRQAGNTEKEHENLQKAQQIDPSIK